MVKIERTPTAPASLAAGKSYNEPDVIAQLEADSHGKCYLCEGKDFMAGIVVEHLLPHHNGKFPDRKFDWNNLFYSCSHCNSVKNQAKYEENVIDCCRTDPEKLICQELVGGVVCVTPLAGTPEASNTAELIRDCFELRNTGIRVIECRNKVRDLQGRMTQLHDELDAYRETKSAGSLRRLRGMLRREAKYAGFSRAYVRAHLSEYPDLEEYVAI